MHVAEIWRYPIKSLAGERLEIADVSALGIAQDREIVIVRSGNQRITTARRYPKLLALRGGLDAAGIPTVNGLRWETAEARTLIEEAVGEPVRVGPDKRTGAVRRPAAARRD